MCSRLYSACLLHEQHLQQPSHSGILSLWLLLGFSAQPLHALFQRTGSLPSLQDQRFLQIQSSPKQTVVCFKSFVNKVCYSEHVLRNKTMHLVSTEKAQWYLSDLSTTLYSFLKIRMHQEQNLRFLHLPWDCSTTAGAWFSYWCPSLSGFVCSANPSDQHKYQSEMQ